jgi:hypothetical protein
MKHKKSMNFTQVFILTLIVSIISVLLFFSFQGNVFSGSNEDALIAACRQSVAIKGTGNSLYTAMDDATRVQVFGANLGSASTILGEDVVPIDIKCFSQDKTIKVKEEMEIKRKLAEEMRSCYFQFWKGEKNPFGSDSRKYCFLCSTISFEKDDLIISDFPTYIKTVKSFNDQNSYYLDYFANCETLGCSYEQSEEIFQNIFPAGGIDYQIDTSKKYVLVYFYEKENSDHSSTISLYAEDELTHETITDVGCIVNLQES